MLVAKLCMVPLMILGISVASRVWGPLVGGMLTGLPIIAGPITLFLFIEQGVDFAIISANSTLLGISALSSFCFVYSWSAQKYSCFISLTFGWVFYFVIAFGLSFVELPPFTSLVFVGSLILLQIRLSPKNTIFLEKLKITNREIFLRMVAASVLVLVVTNLAGLMGPKLSGIFAAFPVAASVLAVFTHTTYSGKHASVLLSGVLLGLISLTVFYFGLSTFVSYMGFYTALTISLLFVLGLQIVSYQLLVSPAKMRA